jgi:hypothetical protein
MSFDEFDATGFKPGMRAEYMNTEYRIGAVNFPERLLGLMDDHDSDAGDATWVRCENATLTNPAHDAQS